MNVKGLDGREHRWNPSSKEAKTDKRSSLHKKAKEVLDSAFPYDRILEEVSLPGTRTSAGGGTLRADFFIPNRNLLVEVHGEQHHKFNSFFYKNKLSFYRAKARDSRKKEWCELNDITLIEFNYDEDIDDWRRKIK